MLISYYKNNTNIANTDFTRGISYQSKYSYNGIELLAGTALDSDKLWLGILRDKDSRFANVAIYSLMSFPYSMSKFLIERQLKKHKLGTLYPNMVEFRPVIKANANYKITYYQIDSTNTWKSIKVGDYIVIGAKLAFQITFDNDASELKEVVSPQLSGIIVEKRPSNPGYNIYSYITSKSPQKINITIDEYIRYEDIVQPYPVVFQIKDRNTNQIYNYGDKIKVGSSIQLTQGENPNLLSGLYRVQSYEYEGETYTYNQLKALVIIITKSGIQLSCNKVWTFDDNEPKCILSPRLLRIPNSSYKILGYIPDISGHGNHGVIHNSAYAEGSGVNEDGSYQFDGVDDFVTIPTTVGGGKQVLMKVNWQKDSVILYDQRGNNDEFAIYAYDEVKKDIAYNSRNNGKTYIDGILNKNIKSSELKGLLHNITIINPLNLGISKKIPVIGANSNYNGFFAQMALYDFMLFDEISTDEGIKNLNDIVGIVSKVELPPYYWDTYGKTNTDADRDEIVNLASDEVSIQYPTDFTDTSVWEDMGAVTSSTILTLTTWAMGGDTGIGNTIKAKVATPAMKVKFITDGNGYLDYMYSGYNTLELPRDAGEYEVELPASTIVDGWGARFSGSGNGSFTIELLGNEVRLGTLKVINSAYDEDSGYGGAGLIVKFSKDYHDNGFWKFVENRSEFNVLNNGDSVNIINAKSVEALFYMAATTKKAFYKVTGVSTGKGIKFGTDNVSPWEGVIAEKDGIYEVDWSLNVHTGTGDLLAPCILSNGWLGDCNIVIEQVKQYPNGIALDGVDDSLVNTDIPTFTDFTVIAKRIFLGDQPNNVVFLFKGDKVYGQGVGNALLMEYRYDNGTYANYIFSNANSITLNEGDISYVTPTDYNGQQMNYVVNTDNKGLVIGRSNAVYWKGVFYKLMLYPKTIDILSINMLKNLFERDEIIDLNNPIFKK